MSFDEDQRRMVFTCVHQNGDKVRVMTRAVVLSDVLNAFEDFLRGSGFYFDGHIDIEPEKDHTNENPDR